MQYNKFMKRSNSTDMRRGTLVRTKACVGTQVAYPRPSCFAENPLEFWKFPSGIHSRDAQPKKTIDMIISHHLPVQLGASLRVHNAKRIAVCWNSVRARGICEKCPKLEVERWKGFSDVKSWNKAKNSLRLMSHQPPSTQSAFSTFPPFSTR